MTSETTFVAPKVRSRLRQRPPHRIRRVQGQLAGVVAVVGLALGVLLAVFIFLRQNAALSLIVAMLPAVGVAVVAVLASRGFKDRTRWSFLAALAIGVLLVGAAVGLLLWVTVGDSGLDGNSAFGVFVLALMLIALGLPLVTNLVAGRSWFRTTAGGPKVVTADVIEAEAAPIATLDEALAAATAEDAAAAAAQALPLVSIRGLKKHFPILGGIL
ncbi:MAG: hypothetical protein L0221_09485, partial [Chloroflexi bacterium]|nr:hypothetical protein [Chloroflexota bacterium]